MNAGDCRAKAEEVESLAGIVSLERDRRELAKQAAGWRARAEQAEASEAPANEVAGAIPRPTFGQRLKDLTRRMVAAMAGG